MPEKKGGGIRENRRLIGPGGRPVGAIERAQHAVTDTIYRAAKEAAGWLAGASLAIVTIAGGGTWVKDAITENFNNASSQTSAESVAVPLAQNFSTPPTQQSATPPDQQPRAAVPQNPASVREGLPFIPPAQALNQMNGLQVEKIVPENIPHGTVQTEPNVREGALWGKVIPGAPPGPLEALTKIFPKLNFGHWSKNELVAKVREHTADDPISAALVKKIIDNESSWNVNAESASRARGLGQFLPQTQLEYMCKYKDMLPSRYAALATHIEPSKTGQGYHIKAGTDVMTKKFIMDAIYDPDVSIILVKEHLRERLTKVDQSFRASLAAEIRYIKNQRRPKDRDRIAEMERHLSRNLTYADAEWAHMMGHGDAANLIAAYADPNKRKHKVSDYANIRSIRSNSGMFFKSSHMMSVEESRARVVEKMGDTPLPRDLSRPAESRLAKISDNPDFQPG